MKNKRHTPILLGIAAAGLGALAMGAWRGWPKPDAQSAEVKATVLEDSRTSTRPPLTVQIPHDTFVALRCYVTATKGEITLIGVAIYDGAANEIRIDKLLMPMQTCTSSHTSVSADAMAQLLVDAIQAGIDTGTLQCWIHSHGALEVFFSGTDDETIETAFPQADWVVNLVTNRAGALKCRLSIYRPIRINVDDVPVRVALPADLEMTIHQEVAEKLRRGHTYGSRSDGGRRSATSTGHDEYNAAGYRYKSAREYSNASADERYPDELTQVEQQRSEYHA